MFYVTSFCLVIACPLFALFCGPDLSILLVYSIFAQYSALLVSIFYHGCFLSILGVMNLKQLGRLAAPITRPSEQAQYQVVSESENSALLSDLVDKVQCERSFSGDFKIATCVVNEISGLQNGLP